MRNMVVWTMTLMAIKQRRLYSSSVNTSASQRSNGIIQVGVRVVDVCLILRNGRGCWGCSLSWWAALVVIFVSFRGKRDSDAADAYLLLVLFR